METTTNVRHIKVLGKGDPTPMGDAAVVRQFVTDLVKRVGMQPLGEPVVHDVPVEVQKLGREPFEDEGGVTAQLVGFHTLSTSHVAIHTWPLREEFHLDLYSCREFSGQEILDFITEVFHTHTMKVSDLSSYCDWEA
jgi:S-adenosylmethionine/arginine decarboxylase-like enzyme